MKYSTRTAWNLNIGLLALTLIVVGVLSRGMTSANHTSRSSLNANGSTELGWQDPLRRQPGTLGMVRVPAGEFDMGDHFEEGETWELPVHTVYTNAFYIDVYEVTNQQYAAALNWALSVGLIHVAGNGRVYNDTSPSTVNCDTTTFNQFQSRITWDGVSFGVVPGKEWHPMVKVSWHGAAAYANWRSIWAGRQPSYDTTTWECDFSASGYRLPTEGEWEKAARGGLQDPYRSYPWGDTIDGSKANYRGSGDPWTHDYPPYTETTPVGYYNGGQVPPGPDMANGYDLYDMAGNAGEWCNDWFSETYYSTSPYDNPRGPSSGTYHVFRGGSWYFFSDFQRCSFRSFEGTGPDDPFFAVGFRMVLDPN